MGESAAESTVATLPIPPNLRSPDDPPYAWWLRRMTAHSGYELVDFARIPAVPCPCGSARRALLDIDDFPGSLHLTDISLDAQLHYHRRLTETYFILQCDADARMQLDDESIPVRPGMAIMVRPGTRHRAVGKMTVLIVVWPKFDPQDEWFD